MSQIKRSGEERAELDDVDPRVDDLQRGLRAFYDEPKQCELGGIDIG